MIQKDYIERCYAGWLGKIIGVRLGSPVEGWQMEDIQKKFGTVKGYLQEYNDYASDDDLNGPIFMLRALSDFGLNATPEQMGRTLLNYAPFEHGFFWWGGYGNSTEHTAYMNLRAGIPAPMSGSVEMNGSVVAEQIGGQIFVDTWGLANPMNPKRAAEYAKRASSVTHGKNGVYGGMFVAACIAAAFGLNNARDVINAALEQIPSDCEYSVMVRDILRFRDEHGGTWKNAFSYIRACWGYDRYPGACHIIPNAAVMILALLYGENDFARTICICTECGWDTDCNAGNLGAVMGAMKGLDSISNDWLSPVHDFLACSSVVGSLNIRDVPDCVVEIARLAYALAGEEYPERYCALLAGKLPKYNFELPRSTHSVRLSTAGRLENTPEQAHTGERSLLISSDSNDANIYFKTYYCERDFSDSRYDPEFSPILYPSQKVVMFVRPRIDRNDITAELFANEVNGSELAHGDKVVLKSGEWTLLSLNIDCDKTAIIHNVGAHMHASSPFECYLDDIIFSGKADYAIDFSKVSPHKWHDSRLSVPQFTHLRGLWRLRDGALSGSGTSHCEAYTGNYDFRNYTVSTEIVPFIGSCFRVLIRVQGAERCYSATLRPDSLSIEKKDGEYISFATVPCDWQYGSPITINVSAFGELLTVSANGAEVMAKDASYAYGQAGLGLENARFEVRKMAVTES